MGRSPSWDFIHQLQYRTSLCKNFRYSQEDLSSLPSPFRSSACALKVHFFYAKLLRSSFKTLHITDLNKTTLHRPHSLLPGGPQFACMADRTGSVVLFPHGTSSFMWWWQPFAQRGAQVPLPPKQTAGACTCPSPPHTPCKDSPQSSCCSPVEVIGARQPCTLRHFSVWRKKKTKHASTTKPIPTDASLLWENFQQILPGFPAACRSFPKETRKKNF